MEQVQFNFDVECTLLQNVIYFFFPILLIDFLIHICYLNRCSNLLTVTRSMWFELVGICGLKWLKVYKQQPSKFINSSSQQQRVNSSSYETVKFCVYNISSSVKRVQGPTRGKKTSRLITQHGGKKLFVGVFSEQRTFVGLNATKAANELGAQIRLQAPLQGIENWEDILPAIRAAIVQSLRDKFEIEGYDESPLVLEVIDIKATHLFKGW